MTNPNNAIGTNAAYSGRTSVNAFNDDLAAYSRGILTGWNCQVGTGLTVLLGGGHSARDVAIAEDNAGNKTTINNISLDEVPVTLDTAPGANSRIDAIVAYVDNPPQGSSSTADNPEACGIIPVAGTPAVDPQAPDDNAIRTAITADGASGTTAYYVVLATVTVPTGTTDLIPGYIEQGDKSVLNTNQIADGSINSSKLDWTTFPSQRLTFTSKDTTQSGTTFVSYTAPENGLYLLTAGVCFQRNGGGSTELLLWAKQGNTSLGNVGAYTSDDGRRTPVRGAWAIKATKGDNLTVGATSVYGNIWTNASFSEIYVTKIA
jgi:hypothetical protein